MIEAVRGGDISLAARCLLAFRDRTGTDEEDVGALIIADAFQDLAAIRTAFQRK